MLQEKVEECYKLMMEVVSGYDEEGKRSKLKKRKFESIIPCSSQNCVKEESFSCDSSSNESWELGASSVSYSSKKTRTQDQLLLNHSNSSDFISIPRQLLISIFTFSASFIFKLIVFFFFVERNIYFILYIFIIFIIKA